MALRKPTTNELDEIVAYISRRSNITIDQGWTTLGTAAVSVLENPAPAPNTDWRKAVMLVRRGAGSTKEVLIWNAEGALGESRSEEVLQAINSSSAT